MVAIPRGGERSGRRSAGLLLPSQHLLVIPLGGGGIEEERIDGAGSAGAIKRSSGSSASAAVAIVADGAYLVAPV
jgi:hypothetical protein